MGHTHKQQDTQERCGKDPRARGRVGVNLGKPVLPSEQGNEMPTKCVDIGAEPDRVVIFVTRFLEEKEMCPEEVGSTPLATRSDGACPGGTAPGRSAAPRTPSSPCTASPSPLARPPARFLPPGIVPFSTGVPRP